MMRLPTQPNVSPICIFLTGATGFLGKVVLEELLRRRSEYPLTKIFLLLRSKREHDAQSRFLHKIASSPCFTSLPKNWLESIEVIEGDASLPNCGINYITYERIHQEITHVIHCAGCISFELPLSEAIEANIDGTLNVYELANASQNLVQLVTTSTAYVTPHTDSTIDENLNHLPVPAKDLLNEIRMGRWSEAEVLKLTGHPNTYTLTKCLAEHLIMEKEEIPVTIIRPSIISASLRYPKPGWIDSAAAFAAFVASIGGGVLHVMDGDVNVMLDIVPVDLVAELIINETLFAKSMSVKISLSADGENKIIAEAPPLARIVTAAATLKHSIRGSTIIKTITDFFSQKSGKTLGIPYIGPHCFKYHILNFTAHTVPLGLAEYYYWLVGNQRMMKLIGNMSLLVATLQRVFPYFTNRTFRFQPERGGLFEQLEKKNRIAGIRGKEQEWDGVEYVRLVCQGVDKHLLSRSRNGR